MVKVVTWNGIKKKIKITKINLGIFIYVFYLLALTIDFLKIKY